ncbi:MAG: tetratricopeptide repeat protein [Nitrospirae bacterium]|nr:tetratricopeptide repeat protein [Nitrospirota bacterium]
MKQNIFSILIIIIIVLPLTYLTYERNKVWKDDVALWEDVVAKAPDNARAHNNLGRAYGANGRDLEAIMEFKKAANILPNYALAYMNMAVSYGRLKMDPEAEFYYKKAIAFYPGLPDIYYNYGFLLYSKQRYEEAYPILSKYIELDPTGPFVPFTNKLLEDIARKNYGK